MPSVGAHASAAFPSNARAQPVSMPLACQVGAWISSPCVHVASTESNCCTVHAFNGAATWKKGHPSDTMTASR
eukprot:scaffold153321_cov22-Tisochrysis_lutea.AAC.2